MFSAAVSHFLNCLLGSSSCLPDTSSAEPPSRRRSRRRRAQTSRLTSSKDSGWTKLTPTELWNRIRKEAQDYYHHAVDGFVSLRSVCLLPDAGIEISSTSTSLCAVKVWTRSWKNMACRRFHCCERSQSRLASRLDINQELS